MWLSCGFPSLGCAANRFRPPRPAGDQIQPYVRSPHKHLSPRHGHAFAPQNTIESHSFFFIPKFRFLSLLLQFFRMLCLRCSAPRPYFVSRPLLPHALCHMDSLLQKPLCSIAIIASETPRATWIAQSCACFENSSQRPPSCHFASPKKHCLRSGAGVIGFFDMCWVMVQLSIQDMFAKSESLLK